MALTKTQRRTRIRSRIRKKVSGTTETPRLAVFRSNKEIYAQIVDDLSGKTLAAASSLQKDLSKDGTKTDVAKAVGAELAKKAVAAGLEVCSFDRGGYLYHGRVKALADGAREGGLKF
jgi:large subunit ribosomal protein L18